MNWDGTSTTITATTHPVLGEVMETRHAADIYEQLKTLRHQLEQLADAGRIVMSRDDLNSRHDSKDALAEAFGALDAAIDATCWMETLATVDGEYPLLDS